MNYAVFKKPSRYIGNEINMSHREADLKVALCFPDTYEIGMSHLGLRVLYSIINNIPFASAERVYTPWTDLEAYLKKQSLPLVSLEHQRPLKDFDIAGFTLQYELSYTNILNMLDMGGIPVKSVDRGDEHPIVLAGGPCAVNPLPLVSFVDAFVVGDGEDVIREIVGAVYEVKSAGKLGSAEEGKFGKGGRGDVLSALSQLEGVYVPSIHDTDKKRIRRRIVQDLDKAPFPVSPPLPFTSIVHDRAAVEISRGCSRGCRFCQAGMIYRPVRERSVEKGLSLSRDSIINTGYEEISFTSLSTGDYEGLLPLIRGFNRMCAGMNISVSLPSLRVGSISSEVLKEIKSVRKTGFTIAPEAGTERLRNVINKDFTEEEYEETLEKLFREGWTNIKLYFMIGLPTETMEDIDGLINMAVRALKKGKAVTGRRVNVNVGISAFVPKPHTPFQWTGQEHSEKLREKQDYIRKAFRKTGIKFKGQHVEHSLLEAVFSRADRDCASLLEHAWKIGCRFDGWSEHFDYDKWLRASEMAGIDLNGYASRDLDPEDELPWDFIDIGITGKYLKSEFTNSRQEKITPDCRKACGVCGLDCRDRAGSRDDGHGDGQSGIREIKRTGDKRAGVPCRLRVRFSKTGEMRYLSHQELMTTVIRAVRRSGLPVAYSTGFHPHPRLSFGPPLATGIEGINESFDIELSALISPGDFMSRLNSNLPEGLEIQGADMIHAQTESLSKDISVYEYEIAVDDQVEELIRSFMGREEYMISREKKRVDIRPMVTGAELKDGILRLVLTDNGNTKVRLHEVLGEMFGTGSEEIQKLMIKRTRLYGYNSIRQINPQRT